MYKGRRGWGENIYVGGKVGRMGRRWDLPPFLLDLVLANIELWPLFCGGYLTLQKKI
jgi:hypothetical protein